MQTLLTVRGLPIYWDPSTGLLRYVAGMTIDADGSPRAYGPNDTGLDDLANAGRPGNWWGILSLGREVLVQRADDPCPGMYVSTTTYQRKQYARSDPRRYLDSESVPFIVIPSTLHKAIGAPILIGSRCTVTRGKLSCEAVVGDDGPATHLGEASIALANALQIPSNPRTGGLDLPVVEYLIHPGQPATLNGETFELQPIG